MIPVKIECACGQHYAFDVEPYKGAMPSRVACPACGADGTHSANEFIAQALAAQPPPPPPVASVRLEVSTAPPPLPPKAPAASFPTASRPKPQRAVSSADNAGKDGWGSEETNFNKLGIYIAITPAIVAAMLSWGMFGVEVPATILCAVVGVCGLIGGAINLAGRGPNPGRSGHWTGHRTGRLRRGVLVDSGPPKRPQV